MIGVALAELHLMPNEFLELTPLEFNNALRHLEERRGNELKLICETLRIQTHWLVNMQLPRRKKIRNPKKLFSLPWDTKPKPQSLEEMKNILRAISAGSKRKSEKSKKE